MLGDRKTYIGGSDAPIIMRVSPFKKRHELLLEKKGLKEPFKGNKHTNFGHIIEESLALSYELEFGTNVIDKQHSLTGECEKFKLSGHIDGIDEKDNTIIDFKATSLTKKYDWKNGVPNYYYYQALFYMYLSSTKNFYFYVGFVDKTTEEWKIVERKRYECCFDKEECDRMLSEIIKFINEIRDDLPQLQGISISEQVKLHEYLLQLKEIKAFESDLKARLLNEMEERGIKKIENDLFSISYVAPTVRRGGIDEEKMKESGINVDDFRKKDSNVKSSVIITMK